MVPAGEANRSEPIQGQIREVGSVHGGGLSHRIQLPIRFARFQTHGLKWRGFAFRLCGLG